MITETFHKDMCQIRISYKW